MNRIKITFAFFIVLTNSFSQDQEPAGYVILTVEDSYKISQHDTQIYFWIIPVDSIMSYNSKMSRLFIAGFTLNNVRDCCSGKPIDPFVFEPSSNFALDPDYISEIENLKELVLKNRRKIQKINKKWESGQAETVLIFATPVLGRFCASDFHPIGQHRTGYHGKVYIPKSSFSAFENFWLSSSANYIRKQDFSLLDFDVIPN